MQWNILEHGVCYLGPFVHVLLGFGFVLWADVWWRNTQEKTTQDHDISLSSDDSSQYTFSAMSECWPPKPQILLSHLGVTCLPRCQRSVTCYTALVSVNCTSQVRQGWQGYYNIWCDVTFYYRHLTLSSFPKLWDRERCYMVHMAGLYFRLWRKDIYTHCTLINHSSLSSGLLYRGWWSWDHTQFTRNQNLWLFRSFSSPEDKYYIFCFQQIFNKYWICLS